MSATTHRPVRRAAAVALAGALLAAGCGGDDDEGSGSSGDDGGGLTATTAAGSGGTDGSGDGGTGAGALGDVEVTLTEVAEAENPTSLVARPGTDVLYVVERAGTVRELAVEGTGADRTYTLADEPLVDISDSVVVDSEQGLLDMAFSADGATLYLSYSLAPDGDTRVDAYTLDGDTLDTGSRVEVLAVEQPAPNHNGGDVELGPDGFLYVALGDGGGAGDPQGNGQDTGALLGKVLRIDPTTPSGDRAYGIPEGNPFADGEGGAPEVWLYGVRNPWRITFDPGSGDLWVADVGQQLWEEVDLLPAADGGGAGANLGWNEMEGAEPYEGGSEPEGAIGPIFQYGHDEGCSITGGVVYDGPVEGLAGAYLFADYCQGVLRAIRAEGGEVADERVWDDVTTSEPVSFGVDAGGDAYVLSLGGTISRVDAA